MLSSAASIGSRLESMGSSTLLPEHCLRRPPEPGLLAMRWVGIANLLRHLGASSVLS